MLVPGRLFQPCLMFWVRPGAYLYDLDGCVTRVVSGLTCKQTRLESLDKDNYSSLLKTVVNYGRKKFKTLDQVFNVIKLSSLTLQANKLECLSLTKKLQPSPIFMTQTGAYWCRVSLKHSSLGLVTSLARKR